MRHCTTRESSTLGKYTNELFGLEYLYEQSEPGSHLFRASVEEPTEDDDEQDDEEHKNEGFLFLLT